MSKRPCFAALATALSLAFAAPAAQAVTAEGYRRDRLGRLDPIITFDPAESYEIVTQELGTNIYDRLMRYEAEDPTKLVGGVAESYTVSPDAKTFVFKLRPNQKFASGAPVTADDMAWSLQSVVILNKTPAFLFNQLGWNKDNVKDLVQATDPGTVDLQDHRGPRALARIEFDEHLRGLGRRKEDSAGERGEWRPRQRLAQDAFGGFRPLQPRLLEA